MPNSKRRNIKADRAEQIPDGSARGNEETRDTPAFLVRLIGARQAKTLAARTNIRHRRD